MGNRDLFNCIFVPQGAEFVAVQRGLRDVPIGDRPPVVAIPAGLTPADAFFRAYSSKLKPQDGSPLEFSDLDPIKP
ncbi:MAG: hypothetical protein EAZ61_04265, partial [Oscillatoriales cyanobacterium]